MPQAVPHHCDLTPRRRRAACLLLSLALGALAGPATAAAQGPDPSELKEAVIVRFNGASIRVDGRLDDAAWEQAIFVSDFRQKDPIFGAPPSDRTEVAFLYDDDAIYIGARMFSSAPDQLPSALTRRDGFGRAEHLTVSLDAFLDRRTASSFTITSGNGRRDYLNTRDADDFRARDYTWNPVWEAKAVLDSIGWTAELRIPFSQLRFSNAAIQSWGLNIQRGMPQKNEDVFWVAVPRNTPGYVSHFGTLVGIEGIKPSSRIELLPYVAGNANYTGSPVPGNPFDDGSIASGRFGGDLKMGLGPSLTLDATINPDFGQVDADPAEVNLSAFESFFPEQRPFFTEGSQLISGGGGEGGSSYFYSRRVGAAPRGSVSADFVDRPGSTRILGAAKVTGRVAAGWELGVFSAVTERTYARSYDADEQEFGRVEVEPVTIFGASRLQHQFGASGSTLGFSLATMRRGFTDGSELADRFSRQSLAGGSDWSLRFQGGAYTVSGRAGFSYVGGSELAMVRIQRSSARYYQRPDADYVEVDSSATALYGVSFGIRASKNSGLWTWNVNLDSDSPGFETNDTGRLTNSDDISASGEIALRQTEPKGIFRRSRVSLSLRSGWNYGGVRREGQVRLSSQGTFMNYMDANFNAQFNPRSMSDNATRGGPLMQNGWRWRMDGNLSNNNSSTTTARLNLTHERGEFDAWSTEVGLRLGFNPTQTLSLSVDPGFSRRVSSRQYVGRFDNGSDATYGYRYVFAKIERSQLSMRLRVNYLFSPNLSLEAYGEPFSASGRYFGFGELAAAGSRFLREYGVAPGTTITQADHRYLVTDTAVPGTLSFGNPDFNSFSFRSNLVIRWEWNPGSTIFLVWQQNRDDFCSGGSVDFCPNGSVPGSQATLASFADPFKLPGDNFLAVKMSYWISVR